MPLSDEQRKRRGLDLLTYSRMSAFKECRYREYVFYQLGVRPAPSEALRIGACIHAATDLLERKSTLFHALYFIAKNYDQLINATQSDEFVDALRIECIKCRALVIGWRNRWVDDSLKVVQSECSYRVPIYNPTTGCKSRLYQQAGKIDGIVEEGGRRGILERKTMSEDIAVGSTYWEKYRLDSQITTYFDAAQSLGFDVSFIFVDAIRKPGISPKRIPTLDGEKKKIVIDAIGERVFKKDGSPRESGDRAKGYELQQHRETPEEYGDRLAEDIRQNPSWYYTRMEIPRLGDDTADHRREMWQLQQDMRRAELGAYPYRNEKSCNTPFRCGLLAACTARVDLEREQPPDGFYHLDYIHPELLEDENASVPASNETAAEVDGEHCTAVCGGPACTYAEATRAHE